MFRKMKSLAKYVWSIPLIHHHHLSLVMTNESHETVLSAASASGVKMYDQWILTRNELFITNSYKIQLRIKTKIRELFLDQDSGLAIILM